MSFYNTCSLRLEQTERIKENYLTEDDWRTRKEYRTGDKKQGVCGF